VQLPHTPFHSSTATIRAARRNPWHRNARGEFPERPRQSQLEVIISHDEGRPTPATGADPTSADKDEGSDPLTMIVEVPPRGAAVDRARDWHRLSPSLRYPLASSAPRSTATYRIALRHRQIPARTQISPVARTST
jgi:hypothetical protein